MRGVLVFVLLFLLAGSVYALDCSSESGIISYWQFESDANDGGGANINNGVATGVTYISSKVSNGAYYGGSTGNDIIVSDSLSLKPSSGLSIQFLMRSDGTYLKIPVDTYPYLFSKQGYEARITDVGGSDKLIVTIGGVDITSTTTIVQGTWYFVSVTWDGAIAKLYLNGVETPENSSIVNTISYSTDSLFIGKKNGQTYNFVGLIDELAIWDIALSPSAISADHAASSAGNDYCYSPSSGSGDGSDTETYFDFPGCRDNIASGQCGRESSPPFFCSDSGVELPVFESSPGSVANACQMGITASNPTPCCPDTFNCVNEDDGVVEFYCTPQGFPCDHWETKDDCMLNDGDIIRNCVWLWDDSSGDDGKCVDPGTVSCADYWNYTSCDDDHYSAASLNPTDTCSGDGVDECGMVAVPGNCDWEVDDEECRYVCAVEPSIVPFGDSPFRLECITSDSQLSDCVDGKRTFNWTVEANSVGDITGGCTADQLIENYNCKNGTKELNCGESLVQLPGFDYLNILAIVLILIAFYFLFRKDIKKGL
jgi:hypothetical protein